MRAWDCAPDLSGDEQMIGFKGNHCDKKRVSYKWEGDGFLMHCVIDYTHFLFFKTYQCHESTTLTVKIHLFTRECYSFLILLEIVITL
jgi:hypothetical protein